MPKQDELSSILDDLRKGVISNHTHHQLWADVDNVLFAVAKSAINSLTLKQVLEVIEKAKPSFVFTANLEGSELGRIVGKALDKYEAELRQSAERIWS